MTRLIALMCLALCAVPAAAQDAETTTRPQPRPEGRAEVAAQPGLLTSLRPPARPREVLLLARGAADNAPAAPNPAARQSPRGGGLCGTDGLQGKALGRIPNDRRGCGIANAVRLEAVAGVRLSQPATLDCSAARALNQWVRQGLAPAARKHTGQSIAQLRVAAHFACRTRNNQSGARLSEHALGRAIDISQITLADGRVLSVEGHWRSDDPASRTLRAAHAAACGPFKTVLGPDADRFHQDHLHFDTAQRSSSYCR